MYFSEITQKIHNIMNITLFSNLDNSIEKILKKKMKFNYKITLQEKITSLLN